MQKTLNVSAEELSAFDNRFTYNRRGQLTDLQRLGTALYRSKRFAGLLASSRYSDIVDNDTLNFLPDQVHAEIRDVEKILQSV